VRFVVRALKNAAFTALLRLVIFGDQNGAVRRDKLGGVYGVGHVVSLADFKVLSLKAE